MRFNKYNDLWTKTTLNTVVERITRRNTNNESNLPLTISAQYGLINQNEFFNKQIASRDLTNYILLNRGEFAYNKSYSSEYPWGAVKRLDKYDKGVLSSLYICFAPKSNVDSDFLIHYFETSKWYNEISNIAGEGARNHGLLNMAVSDYFNTKHSFPSIQEQHKISQFLNLINQRIDTQSKIIEKYESLIKVINQMMCNFDHEKIQVQNVFDFKEKTKHQANMGNSQGNFIYFTNEESTYKYFDSYDFDGEYIIANTGGKANFKYYNGKFAVMSDCLVMECNDNQNTKFYLYSILNRIDYINQVCFVGSGLKHLDKKLFFKTFITKFNNNLEPFINLIILLEKKISNDKILLQKLKEQKKYLLSNMFI